MATLSPNILPLMGLNPSGDLGPFTIFRTKRQGVVWFPRSPPNKPASYLQRRNRNRWSFAARVWSAMTDPQRQKWFDITRIARLTISGYNLFIYFQVTKNQATIETLQRYTGITVL